MTVSLVTIGKKGVRKEFPIEGQAVVIGRGTEADLRIPTPDVSRSHCQVAIRGNQINIRDLGSSNGTFVNDQKVAQATLKAGDRIRIGSIVFVVFVDGHGAKNSPNVPSKLKPVAATPPPPKEPVLSADALGEDTDEIDIDEIGDLDVDELSDLNIDDLVDNAADDSGEIGDVEDLPELDEDDLISDEDDKTRKGNKKR